jgi:hypothetical protein
MKEISSFECNNKQYRIVEGLTGYEVYCDDKKVQDKFSVQELMNYMGNIIFNQSYMREKAENRVKELEKQIKIK